MASGERGGARYHVAFDLVDRRCLVVGGGPVATRRVAGLRDAGARIRLVAPTITDELSALVAAGTIDDYRAGEYRPADLAGCALAIAASSDRALNRLIADDAGAAGIPVNVVDAPERSTFTVPATLRRDGVSVAIATGDASPVLARSLRERLAGVVGPEWGALAELLRASRPELIEAIPDPAERSAVVDRLIRGDILDLLARGDQDGARRQVDDAVAGRAPVGQVALVGAGPGDPDLVTVRGATLIARADAIVHDRLGTDALLPLARTGCELIDVGKVPGRHGMPQEEITELLITLARRGHRVVRLKGGDPFVFGRGGEEALTLAAAGLTFEVVPGVSSAIGGAAAAGIPVTHRGLAQSVTIASGHDDPHAPAGAARWDALAGVPGTLVLLMAMTHLAGITERLVAAGRPADDPAAVVHWATTGAQRVVDGRLATIAAVCAAAGVDNPAVVVIGPVVEVGRQIAETLARATATPHP